MIKVGQKVTFKPFKGIRFNGSTEMEDIVVEGVVHFVHPTHHWFNIEYGGEEGKRLTSYKFDDIGKSVKAVGE